MCHHRPPGPPVTLGVASLLTQDAAPTSTAWGPHVPTGPQTYRAECFSPVSLLYINRLAKGTDEGRGKLSSPLHVFQIHGESLPRKLSKYLELTFN